MTPGRRLSAIARLLVSVGVALACGLDGCRCGKCGGWGCRPRVDEGRDLYLRTRWVYLVHLKRMVAVRMARRSHMACCVRAIKMCATINNAPNITGTFLLRYEKWLPLALLLRSCGRKNSTKKVPTSSGWQAVRVEVCCLSDMATHCDSASSIALNRMAKKLPCWYSADKGSDEIDS